MYLMGPLQTASQLRRARVGVADLHTLTSIFSELASLVTL